MRNGIRDVLQLSITLSYVAHSYLVPVHWLVKLSTQGCGINCVACMQIAYKYATDFGKTVQSAPVQNAVQGKGKGKGNGKAKSKSCVKIKKREK